MGSWCIHLLSFRNTFNNGFVGRIAWQLNLRTASEVLPLRYETWLKNMVKFKFVKIHYTKRYTATNVLSQFKMFTFFTVTLTLAKNEKSHGAQSGGKGGGGRTVTLLKGCLSTGWHLTAAFIIFLIIFYEDTHKRSLSELLKKDARMMRKVYLN